MTLTIIGWVVYVLVLSAMSFIVIGLLGEKSLFAFTVCFIILALLTLPFIFWGGGQSLVKLPLDKVIVV